MIATDVPNELRTLNGRFDLRLIERFGLNGEFFTLLRPLGMLV
jgi:hypothetical protein